MTNNLNKKIEKFLNCYLLKSKIFFSKENFITKQNWPHKIINIISESLFCYMDLSLIVTITVCKRLVLILDWQYGAYEK